MIITYVMIYNMFKYVYIYTCFILYPYHTPYYDNIYKFYTEKSILICFSLKIGRSDTTS